MEPKSSTMSRSRWAALVTVGMLAAALLTPAIVHADRFKGTFDHGKHRVVFKTTRRDKAKEILFYKWDADCRDGTRVTKGIYQFGVPFDTSSRNFVHDQGRATIHSDGFTEKTRGSFTGHRVSKRTWKGTFKLRFKLILDNGHTTHCKMPDTRWTATK